MDVRSGIAAGRSRPGGLFWHRDFRWLWLGESTSKIGSSMTVVAMPLVAVLTLNASASTVGFLQASAWLPWLLFGLPAGAWVDRLAKRPVMLVCDLVSFVLFASVPIAAWFGFLTTAQLMVVAFMTGVAAVFFSIAYTPYLPILVAKPDLGEANAKLQGTESAAQFVGPGLAGLIAQFVGAVNGLLLDALTFAFSAFCLSRVSVKEAPRQSRSKSGTTLRSEIREGLRFIVHDPYLRVMTLYAGASNFAEAILEAVLVVFLVRTVGLSPGLTGVLIAVVSLGGVLGSTVSTTVARRFGSARAILLCEGIAVPFGLLLPLTTKGAGLALFVIGGAVPLAGVIASNILGASFRQSYVPAHLLGRSTSAGRLVGYGSIPLGAVAGALLSGVIGLYATVWIGVIAATASVLILFVGPIRKHRDFPTVTATLPLAVSGSH